MKLFASSKGPQINNLSIKSVSIPKDWKVANVNPNFKKASREDLGKYRPIGLMSIMGKLGESVIKNS